MLDKFKDYLIQEAKAIEAIPVGPEVVCAIDILVKCEGKVFTTGIGKAGYVARKAASTFSTTGTPASFLHPGDASHGDVGVVTSRDVVVAFSNSGQTREVLETVTFCKHLSVGAVIAITGKPNSALSELSEVVVNIGETPEACPLGLTPTSSTTAMVAISDALALSVMTEKGFNADDFAIRHHGGYLGEQLKIRKAV